jgi:hypothetical protein
MEFADVSSVYNLLIARILLLQEAASKKNSTFYAGIGSIGPMNKGTNYF